MGVTVRNQRNMWGKKTCPVSFHCHCQEWKKKYEEVHYCLLLTWILRHKIKSAIMAGEFSSMLIAYAYVPQPFSLYHKPQSIQLRLPREFQFFYCLEQTGLRRYCIQNTCMKSCRRRDAQVSTNYLPIKIIVEGGKVVPCRWDCVAV